MSKHIYTEILNPYGNLLFTIDQLNAAKTNDKCLAVRCLQCGKIFYISRKQYIVFITRYQRGDSKTGLKYCCRDCSLTHQKETATAVTKPCLVCGKPVTKYRSEAEKYPNFFCCQSHAASYNNTHRAPRSEESRAKTSLSVCQSCIDRKTWLKNLHKGHHTTWNGKIVYYRSSYELDYCMQLDKQKVDYDLESLFIVYFDTQRKQSRRAIPDFYLPETNTLVEIKSTYTYDKQNMIDRSEQYKKLGYNFKLILDHKEYDYCP